MPLHYGKLAYVDDPLDLRLSDYVDPSALPTPPDQFGHEQFIGAKSWGMLGNDECGDCALAGPAHETMLLNNEAGREVSFTTAALDLLMTTCGP